MTKLTEIDVGDKIDDAKKHLDEIADKVSINILTILTYAGCVAAGLAIGFIAGYYSV